MYGIGDLLVSILLFMLVLAGVIVVGIRTLVGIVDAVVYNVCIVVVVNIDVFDGGDSRRIY